MTPMSGPPLFNYQNSTNKWSPIDHAKDSSGGYDLAEPGSIPLFFLLSLLMPSVHPSSQHADQRLQSQLFVANMKRKEIGKKGCDSNIIRLIIYYIQKRVTQWYLPMTYSTNLLSCCLVLSKFILINYSPRTEATQKKGRINRVSQILQSVPR